MNLPVRHEDIQEVSKRLDEVVHALSGKTVLISGGNGFLGRYMIRVLLHLNEEKLERPCRIVAIDNLITSNDPLPEGNPEEFVFLNQDVVQPITWKDSIDYIIHAAGIASPFYYRAHPLETLDVCTLGTRNLLELAREHGARFLFISSSEIYGDPHPDHVPTPESYKGSVACIGPRACYDEGKRLGETLAHVFHGTYGVQTVMVRPFNVYGPGMREYDYRVLPNFANAIKGRRPVRIYGSGRQTRTYCYVTDALVGFFLTLLHGVAGEPYNIGTPEPELSVPELVERIGKVMGREVEAVLTDYPDTYPADEPTRRCPDIRKAKVQLGYEPTVELDEGLARFFSWTELHYSGRP